MIVLAFILMAAGGLLFAEVFRLSQRGLHGFEIRSPVVYNFRGILQLLSFLMLFGAVVMLFIEKWWLGIVGLVVAPLSTIAHVVVFARMDPEVKEKLFGSSEDD